MSKIQVYKNDYTIIVDSNEILSKYYRTSFLVLATDISDEVHILFAAHKKYNHLVKYESKISTL